MNINIICWKKKWRVVKEKSKKASHVADYSELAYHYACHKFPAATIYVHETNGTVKFRRKPDNKIDLQ